MQHRSATVICLVDCDVLLALCDTEAALGDFRGDAEWTAGEFLRQKLR